MSKVAESPEVVSDRTSVWVNAPTGECIGRFGKQGIDVHRKLKEQGELGECLHCTHGPTSEADWSVFVGKMKEHHGVEIAKRHKPRRFIA